MIVPPHVEDGVLSEQTDQALETLSRALKVDGFDLIRPGQSGPAAEEAQARDLFPKDQNPLNCVSPDCAVSFARLFDAAFAVQISMFREPGRGNIQHGGRVEKRRGRESPACPRRRSG